MVRSIVSGATHPSVMALFTYYHRHFPTQLLFSTCYNPPAPIHLQHKLPLVLKSCQCLWTWDLLFSTPDIYSPRT